MVVLAQDFGRFPGTRSLWQLVVGKFGLCSLCPTICPRPGVSSQLRTKTESERQRPVTIAITWTLMLKRALSQDNVCVPRKCEGRFMVFKIHELQGMERSFSEYRKETERLCLLNTQAMVHPSQKNLIKPIIQHAIEPFPSHLKKRLQFFSLFSAFHWIL